VAQQIGAYTPKQAKRIWDAVQAFERSGTASQGAFLPYTPTPIYFVNKSTETIPPYGCVQMIGSSEIDGTTYIEVDRPFDYTDSVMGPFLLNGPGECLQDEIGTAQWGPVFRATKDSATYTTGTRMGPVASSFDLSKGCLFTYIGDDEQEVDLIKVIACETPLLAVAGSSGIAGNSSGTVTAKSPASGNWTAGTITYTAWAPTSAAISANATVMIFPIDAKWVAVEIC
jgi:hypothetical protein